MEDEAVGSPSSSVLAGAYTCPDGYVSRVVYFADRPDPAWFEHFLRAQVGDRLNPMDIRYATRHGWELGREAEEKIKKLKHQEVRQFYWTFYPRGDEKSGSTRGTFLCSKQAGGCGRRLFVKELSESNKLLCPACEKK